MAWIKHSKVNQRLQLVGAMMGKEKSVAQLCREAGVSRQTGYKFLARYEALGRAGLEDQSRARRASGRPLWRRRVLALRRCWPTWGGAKLHHRLGRRWPGKPLPSQRTIERWLQQAGVSRRQRNRVRCGQKMAVKCRVARSCNQVWTADLKGWFRTGDGRRIEPLTVRDLHSRYLLAVRAASTRERDIRRIFTELFRELWAAEDHPHRSWSAVLWTGATSADEAESVVAPAGHQSAVRAPARRHQQQRA